MKKGITSKIRELLWKNRTVSKKDIVKEVGRSWNSIRQLIDEMKKRGEIDFDEHNVWLKKKIIKDADKIWRAIEIAKTFTPAEISLLTDIDRKIVINYICKFVKCGAVVKIGKNGKKTIYRVLKEKRPNLRNK